MSNLSLLFAEDDIEALDNYSILLRPMFKTIYKASNGKQALELYKEKRPDILLFDISMPDMNELDAIEYIRGEDAEVPIIILSAHSERDQLLHAINLNLRGYLVKPIEPHVLRQTIANVISKLEQKFTVELHNNYKWNKSTSTLLCHDKSVKLTKKEQLLMEILVANKGAYFSHDSLIISIWHDEIPDDTHHKKLVQLVYRLNKKLFSDTECKEPLVENSYSRGYKLV